MNMNDNVYEALKILIRISKNAQEDTPEIARHMSVMQWNKELCTVKVGTARRGGHTTAILRLMEDSEMNIGCVFANNDLAKMFQKLYNSSKPHNKGILDFCCSTHNFKYNIMGKDFSNLDAIVFDNAFMMSKKKESEIYHSLNPALCRNTGVRPFFFIFLQ